MKGLDRLIAAAKQHDHPPVEATEHAWASLQSAIEAGIGPSVPLAASASTGLGAKGLVIVAVAVVMAGGAAIGLRTAEEPAATPSIVERVEPTDPPDPPRAVQNVVPPTVVEPPPVVQTPSVEPTKAEPRRSESRPATAPAVANTSTLAEQAKLLGQAWKAVNASDTTRALELVAEHARRFPDSPLAPEREACRIVAWCQDDRPWADAKAKAFLAAHGGMPASRVRQACEKNP